MQNDLPSASSDEVLQALDLDRLIADAGEAVVFANLDWVVCYCNDVYLRQTGMTRAEVIGRKPWDYQPLFKRSVFYEPIETCRIERRPMASLGYSTLLTRCVLMRVFPVQGGMLLLAGDASDSVVREFQMAKEALEDALTGLPNKLAMVQDTQARLNAGESFTLGLLGLRHLRAINDAHGFASGDLAMIEVASRLQLLTKPGERLYRLSTDEFVLIVPTSRATEAEAEARLLVLMSEVRKPFTLKGRIFTLSACAGTVAAPEFGADPELLLHRATMALRRAQSTGEAKLVPYLPKIEHDIHAQADLEEEVRHALRNGEFTLYLQPKASLNGERLTGAEALLRWPRKGAMVSPVTFLPVLESCGLMPELDQWVLRTTLGYLKDLHARGTPVPISINLSVHSLADSRLVDNVREALASAGVAPGLLEVEIPEGSLMHDVDTSTRVLAGLHELGVRISVDDFGTGYSSFAYLARFPVHTLKIDRSFVMDMTRNEASRKIVGGLVRLAHSLSLTVVAEGAETRDQMAMLKRLRCDEMQGYGYARPMPFEKFVELAAASVSVAKGPDPFGM